MSIYRLLIHRFAVPLPSQGKAHEETQLTDKPQLEIMKNPNQHSIGTSFPINGTFTKSRGLWRMIKSIYAQICSAVRR